MAMKPCKYGHPAERGTQYHCLECRRLRAKKYRRENPEEAKRRGRAYHAANRERRNEGSRNYYRSNFKRTMLQNAQKRARQGGFACTLTIEDIVIPEFCPLLGIKIEVGGELRATSPSLDKIRPELGYVPGNVWVISWRANMIKNDATLQELELLARNLRTRLWIPIPNGTASALAVEQPWMVSNAN